MDLLKEIAAARRYPWHPMQPADTSQASPERKRPQTVGIAIAVVGLIALGGLWIRLRAERPRLIGHAASFPEGARPASGAWVWLERLKASDVRLIRLGSDRRAVPIATASALTDYAADGDAVAWIEKQGGQWRVQLADDPDRAPRTLWAGATEPHGVCLAGDGVYWLAPHAPEAPDCGPLPPFGPSMDLLTAPRSGGASHAVGRLFGAIGGRVLGARDGAIYVAAYRGLGIGSTTFYRVRPGNPAPERLASEIGQQRALLARDGSLYWLAPSREATADAGLCCIRRLAPGGRPETLSDWLPARGALFETDRGVRYVDVEEHAGVWPTGAFLEAPRSATAPTGYRYLAVGGDRALLCPQNAWLGPTPLYEGPLP